ncbi:MAG: prepilin-type N-terminal cleavage/methylation domain-containing protein [Blastocatellia bacterium]|nr:prepilin-type N-terminal cleavage/methylation domain-containing protein [Blastocatellia bacterium]
MLKPGTKFRRQAGFSLFELLIVVAIMFVVMAGFASSMFESAKGEQYRPEKAAAQFYDLVMQKRLNARLGTGMSELRTLKLSDLQLPTGVRINSNFKPHQFAPNAKIYEGSETIEFEAQTGRTQGGEQGVIVFEDMVKGRMVAVYIPNIYAPLQRFVKYPNQDFRPMTDSIY